jgi:deoxyribonuclease-1
MKKTLVIGAILTLITASAMATSNGGVKRTKDVISFTTAKNKLYSKVFNNSGKTLYCGCDWSDRKTNLNSCNLQSYFPKKQRKRSLRTEAEHIIPASWMLKVNNKKRQCSIDSKGSKDSAREYCQKHSAEYKQAHNDLVNLYPAVGQINADRSNKPFVDITKLRLKLTVNVIFK